MKKTASKKPESEFILSARRAFRRVARNLRVENARVGLPLIQGENGRIKRVRLDKTSAR
jgi:hypothetical protein